MKNLEDQRNVCTGFRKQSHLNKNCQKALIVIESITGSEGTFPTPTASAANRHGVEPSQVDKCLKCNLRNNEIKYLKKSENEYTHEPSLYSWNKDESHCLKLCELKKRSNG